MIHIVKDVEIVSLPLRLAMVADRAEVALTRYEREECLREQDTPERRFLVLGNVPYGSRETRS